MTINDDRNWRTDFELRYAGNPQRCEQYEPA